MHPIADRRGFTLIEVLVVVSIIALLAAILMPAIGAASRAAKLGHCQSNVGQILPAFDAYRLNNRDLYPGGLYHGAAITEHNLFGKQGGAGDATPEADRVLNEYHQVLDIAQCPLDNGTHSKEEPEWDTYDDTDEYQFTKFAYDGFSYAYPTRTPEEIGKREAVFDAGIWKIGGHRASEIELPDRKLLITDGVYHPRFEAKDPVNQWHRVVEPIMISVGFADGHVDHFERKMKDGQLGYEVGEHTIDLSGANGDVQMKQYIAEKLLQGKFWNVVDEVEEYRASPYY